jgi:CelD/BcsL family acetyltransferase involved in cellulose biosynthesis
LERAAGLTLYQSFRWNYAAARMLSGEPCVVAAEHSSGAAIIPSAIEHGRVTLIGDALFDYRDVLGNSQEALAAAWREVGSWGVPLEFVALRDDSPHDFWKAVSRPSFCGAPGISVEDTSAEAFTQRHWRQAKQMRRLYREGARLAHAHGSHAGLVRWIYRQKVAQLADDPRNVFSDPRRVEFLVEMANREDTRCDVYCLEMGSTILSSLITFRDDAYGIRPVRRYYTTTFDHRWARLSPGIALLYEVARQSLEEGIDVDFQTGEQFHKSRLAMRSVPLYRMSLPASEVAALPEALTGTARAAA